MGDETIGAVVVTPVTRPRRCLSTLASQPKVNHLAKRKKTKIIIHRT